MHDDLERTLTVLRARRHFDAVRVVDAKVALINGYFAAHRLTAAVVGVSGGVDSAVTLALLRKAAISFGSPLRRVVAAVMPMHCDGATNQDEATRRGKQVAEWAGADLDVVDLSSTHGSMRAAIGVLSPWASGQVVSMLRTPALYGLVAQLSDQGERGVVVGTTNRDEGAYLGFFGKASDAMVDLQPISDLHKSEVYAVARAFGAPAPVLDAPPSGDVFDGRVDEQMIGAPYDAVELVTALKACSEADRASLKSAWSEGARAQFDAWSLAIEAMHVHNAHKYAVGSPAVHLDCLERGVPGGWSEPAPPDAPKDGPFVGRFQPRRYPVATWRAPEVRAVGDLGVSGYVATGVIDAKPDLEGVSWMPVGLDGRPRTDSATPIGSWRATSVDPALADAIWQRLRATLPCVRVFGEEDPTDHGGHATWRPVGLNPVMRYIKYAPGGRLVPHYDAGHDFADGRHHTLTSVIISLDGRGATRFLLDRQRHLPVHWRDLSDADAARVAGDPLARVSMALGDALVFDHRVLHDAEPWDGPGERLVLRTDVIWRRCGPPFARQIPVRPHHERLSVSPRARRDAVDKAWKAIAMPSAADRLAWRVLRDPYVGPAYAVIGDDAIGPSGFFDDKTEALVDPRETPDWWVTPPPPAVEIDPAKWPCVLLGTGSYCPAHVGHKEMFVRAREALEAAGAQVLAGYMSVGHDDYVLQKVRGGPQAGDRIGQCEDLVRDTPWLFVDPWEALHTPTALNYTDVVAHLEGVMSRWVRSLRPVRVVYLTGGDNAGFALSFAARGRCVIVTRPGYEGVTERITRHRAVRNNPRVHVVVGARAEASRAIRKTATVAPPMLAEFRLTVRDEGDWAIEPWAGRRGVPEAWKAFGDGIVADLGRAFAQGGLDLDLVRVDLAAQRAELSKVRRPEPFVSLDPCLPGDVSLGVSRLFDVSSTRGPVGLTARPGTLPLADQLVGIPRGDVVLVDDDRHTGATLEAVKALLPPQVNVVDEIVLTEIGTDADLVDLRDLLPGAREAGLVVRLPNGTVGRAPYALPYVRPGARLGLPWAQEVAFSLAVWARAEAFYLATGFAVRDTWPAFRELLRHVGFGPETPMREVCAWHRERLRGRTAWRV